MKFLLLALFPAFAGVSLAAELAPDDASVAGSLALWLRDPDIDYDAGGGLWSDSSGNGNDAQAFADIGGTTFVPPTLATIGGGGLSGDDLTGVRFSGGANDLMATPALNGGAGLSQLTLITVYRSSTTQSLQRPLGIGSMVGQGGLNPGNHFNLGSDPSIRKDNGSIGGHSQGTPIGAPFIRSARMDGAGVDEWFNESGTPVAVLTDGGAGYTTSSDIFYLGDLRDNPGANFEIVEVLVYTTALSDQQILDINDWLVAHISGPPPPLVNSFTAAPGLISSGESSTLDWDVERATSVSIAPAPGAVALVGSASVSPLTSTTYTLTATGDGGIVTAEVTIGVDVPVDEPLITEFLASNDNILDDEDGDGSDWLEIHNPNAFPIDVGGYFLTDSAALLNKWALPAGTTISGGGYLIVFASAKDRAVAGMELHTNFNLNRGGEYLALVKPDATTVVSEFAPSYPGQISDISYGPDSGGALRYLSPPTPGAPNGGGFFGKVADTKFSVDRGFYDSPQSVVITTDTPMAEIRYTTDGSEPTASHGAVYSAPVPITTTTVLRAAAFKTDYLPTDVDTHSYLFLDDVIRQPSNPAGFPATWGTRTPDYAMDQRVVDDPAYSDEIIDGLKSIRTLSIVVDNDDFFNNPNGIYANPRNDGRAWEREVSFEFLHPDDPGEDIQTNCGIRIHGNGSRSPSGQPKHGFRVEFRGEYGAKRLNYRLFPDSDVDEFDNIILRGQNAHGWTRSSQIGNSVGTSEREQSQYIRDSFARDLMKGMGQTSGEATYVHLYINGAYWGLYNPVEYPRSYYGVSHFGGDEEDWDIINRRTTTTKILDGTFDAWNAMQALADSGLTTQAKYEEMETHMNIDNLIDYMLMHQYMGSRDGPEVFNSNNMRSLRKTRGASTTTWIGMPWDMEASMFEIDVTRNVNVGSESAQANSLARVYSKLRENAEFRLRYADRVHMHCFNGGTLTPALTAAIWEARANEIYTAIIGESARWGDYRRASQPFTRDAEWQQERTRLLTTYFPTRTDFLVNLLRTNGLYPAVDAPVFGQHGGQVPEDFPLTMSATSGTIYYTLDGSDPREAWTGTAIGTAYGSAPMLTDSGVVKARALDGGVWSALNSAEFVVGTPAVAGKLVVGEIHYNPPGASEDGEFVELVNVSNETLQLGGVRFDAGIGYTFPLGVELAPGARVVLGSSDYTGNLDNDGEELALVDAEGNDIERFEYDDQPAWPESPDDGGPSLTRILGAPGGLNDPGDPRSWRPSSTAGGTAGTTDAVEFVGDPMADLDKDTLAALIEHAFGTSDSSPDSPGDLWSLAFGEGGELVLTHLRGTTADDAAILIDESSDLVNWAPSVAFTMISSDAGSRTYTAPSAGERRFFRLRVVRD